MKNKQISLLIGRENLEKDSHLYTDVFAKLHKLPFTFFYDPSDQIRKIIKLPLFRFLPKSLRESNWIRKIARTGIIAIVFFKQGLFDISYIKAFRKNPNDIHLRMIALLNQLKKFPTDSQITLIGRSAGAILATKVSLHIPIKQIICLGYPFKYPGEVDETYRFAHLVEVNTPTLIIQGERDSYGGREIIEKYQLNPSTELIFEDLDHDFQLTEETRIRLINLIKTRIMGD
jgi:hypothetical protein